MSKIILITGLTASGKTDLANKYLANHPQVHPICCDSTQFYKEVSHIANCNVKSSKTHLYGVLNLSQPYSITDYIKSAHPIIINELAQKKLALIEGGSVYYADCLLNNKVDMIENYEKYHAEAKELVSKGVKNDEIKVNFKDTKKYTNHMARLLANQAKANVIKHDLSKYEQRIIFNYRKFNVMSDQINIRANRLFSDMEAYKEAVEVIKASKANKKIMGILGVYQLAQVILYFNPSAYTTSYSWAVRNYAKSQILYFNKFFGNKNVYYSSDYEENLIEDIANASHNDYINKCSRSKRLFETLSSMDFLFPRKVCFNTHTLQEIRKISEFYRPLLLKEGNIKIAK